MFKIQILRGGDRMRRFVKHFYSWYDDAPIEDRINDYAETNNLNIITIAPMSGNGIYVLFEEIQD